MALGPLTLNRAASWSSRKSCLPACFQGIRNMVLSASSQHTPGNCPLSNCSIIQLRSFRVLRGLPEAILGREAGYRELFFQLETGSHYVILDSLGLTI